MKKSIKKEIFKALFNILLGVIIGVGGRYLADYVYDSMRRGGLTPALPFVHTDSRGDARKTDVYLIPFEGFSPIDASRLSTFLSDDLGIVVKATGCKPMPEGLYNEERKQFVSEGFYDSLYASSKTQLDTTDNAVFIGLVAGDMYPQKSNWNFCFTANFTNRMSVIATDRFVPYGVLNKEKAGKIYGGRLAKMIKRTIGIQYFGFPISSDPESLLFSPIMGLEQVDRMGFSYKQAKKEGESEIADH